MSDSLPSGEVPPSLPSPTPVPQTALSSEAGVRSGPLTGRDWVVVWFAAAVFLLIALISVKLFLSWDTPPPALSSMPLKDQTDAVAHYKELTAILGERTEKFFDLTITKALLPLFATLVGFLLGKRNHLD